MASSSLAADASRLGTQNATTHSTQTLGADI
jgi:hypothetical protein